MRIENQAPTPVTNEDFKRLVLYDVKDPETKELTKYGDMAISIPIGVHEFATIFVSPSQLERSQKDGRVNICLDENVTVYFENGTKERTSAATLIQAYNNARKNYAKESYAKNFEEEAERG